MSDPAGPAFRSSLARAQGRSPAFRALALIGSAPVAALLITVVAAVCWIATYYEAAYGREAAAALVYGAWWFNGMFLALAMAVLAAVVVRWPWQRHQYGFVVVHAGLLALIAGFAVAGRDRLDGMLMAPPGQEASQVELPVDYVAAIVEPALAAPATGAAVQGEARSTYLQPLACAGLPSFPRFCLTPLWPYQVPGISRQGRPLPLLELPASGVRVGLGAVADTARPEPGRSPADTGEPAVRVDLRLRTPGSSEDRAMGGRWLLAEGDAGQYLVGPLAVTFATAATPALAEAFAHPPAELPPAGRLRLSWGGRIHDLDLDPARLPHEARIADDLVVTVEKLIANPAYRNGSLVQDDQAEANPVVMFGLKAGTGAAARSNRGWSAAGAMMPQLGPGWPEVLYEHPLWLKGVGAGKVQGGVAMLLGGPDGTLLLRTATRSHGLGRSAAIAPGGGWTGDVVGGEGAPMRVGLDLRWLARSQPGPEPVAMDPGKKDRAVRWIELVVAHAGGEQRVWLPRGGGRQVQAGNQSVLLRYDRGRMDLRRERGFAVRLERFDEGRDPGGMRSASYASEVTVLADGGERKARITMNQPLQVGGVTLYQTAFSPELGPDGMPTGRQVSTFTVAEDRGRWLKYAGSALLVLGMVLLWWLRPRPRTPAAQPTPAPETP